MHKSAMTVLLLFKNCRTLVKNLNDYYDKGQSDMRVVHTYEWADPSDAVDPAQWDEMLQVSGWLLYRA